MISSTSYYYLTLSLRVFSMCFYSYLLLFLCAMNRIDTAVTALCKCYCFLRGSAGRLEIDFESNPRDILNSAHQELDFATEVRPVSEYMPEYRRSLRVCIILTFAHTRCIGLFSVAVCQQQYRTSRQCYVCYCMCMYFIYIYIYIYIYINVSTY